VLQTYRAPLREDGNKLCLSDQSGARGENESCLAPASQFGIDFRKNSGIEQRAMFGPPGRHFVACVADL
jgi:hypothetical protein